MDEEQKNTPPMGGEKKVCKPSQGYCFCKAIFAALIIVLVWFWTPSWANIAITVLAAIIILTAGTCCCRKKAK